MLSALHPHAPPRSLQHHRSTKSILHTRLTACPQDGRPFSDQQLLGEFSVLYFGFTHCPDICPDEMEKLAEAVDGVEVATGR